MEGDTPHLQKILAAKYKTGNTILHFRRIVLPKEYVNANPGLFGIDKEFVSHPERLAAEKLEAQSALYKKAYNDFGNEIFRQKRDMGAVLAELGYDAINAVGHGKSGSYVVILNRTKVILLGDN